MEIGCKMVRMFRPEVRKKIQQELLQGEAARDQGLEGRARVCARRAAGAAIREYLEQRGEPSPGPSAVDALEYLRSASGFLPQIQTVADHLLARVDENHQLPVDVDLLAEARWLVQALESLTD